MLRLAALLPRGAPLRSRVFHASAFALQDALDMKDTFARRHGT